MKKNIIIILYFVLAGIFNLNIYALDEKQLFEAIVLKNNSYLPESFKAIVQGKEINDSLNQIPARSRRGSMFVEFLYHKNYGERIIVKNVDEIYKDRFAVYLNMYNEFKVFLTKKESFNTFTKVHEWKIIQNTPAFYLVKMRKLRNRDGDYFALKIDKKTFLINYVIRYENNNAVDTYAFSYQKVRNFTLISRFIFKGKVNQEQKTITFNLTSFNINPGLSESDFLD